MTLGEIIELIFGLAMTAFMLYIILIIPFGLLSDSKKSRYRRRKRSAYRQYKSYTYSPPDFDYYHSYNKTEFFVYFIENEKLDALKIGVGSGGRVLQLLNSYQEKSEQSESVGWKLLRLAKFSDYENSYDLGKIYANEAEKKAHYYWRNVLKLPIHLNDFQMGYSKVRNYGDINWTLTKGYSETVDMSRVCEVSTWNYVINSYGFIEEHNEFMGTDPRELQLLHPDHSILDVPENYEAFKLRKVNHYFKKELAPRERKSVEERFWSKVDKTDLGCWDWTGAKSNKKNGYGVFQLSDHLTTAHKVAWILEGNEELGDSLMDNLCGNRSCVKPEHWKKSDRTFSTDEKPRISNFKCTNEGCERPSRAIHKSSLCEPCRQKVKKIRQKKGNQLSVENYSSLQDKDLINLNPIGIKMIGKISVYQCISEGCAWPSSSMLESTYCEICKKKRAKRQDK
jgi:hypothetical protein